MFVPDAIAAKNLLTNLLKYSSGVWIVLKMLFCVEKYFSIKYSKSNFKVYLSHSFIYKPVKSSVFGGLY